MAFVAVLMAVAGCVADDVGPINVLTTEVGHPSPTYDPADDGSTVGAGRKALEVNPDINAAVAAIQARAGVRPPAIMTAAAN